MIPAVPDYLQKTSFNDTPPGHRFSLYLSAWKEQDFTLDKNNKMRAIKGTLSVSHESRQQIDAIRERQLMLLFDYPENNQLVMEAQSISPMATGMGMEHPLENGFAFLNPYGLPYLPGSSIKGVLRRAAEELHEMGEEWTQDNIDCLFGPESQDEDKAQRGVLIFWDVIPALSQMGVEIMTPHYSDYYQGKESPHDSGQPTPIPFLVVPPKAKFRFIVTANRKYLADVSDWQKLLRQAFEHAFNWLGFGAKTSVGYGGMQEDVHEKQRLQNEAEKRKEEQAREAALLERISGLPDDAAAIEKARSSWSNPGDFLDFAERLLEEHKELSQAARARLVEIVESYWKGIMRNPDATQGKKKKPKFKPRPVALAKRLTSIKS